MIRRKKPKKAAAKSDVFQSMPMLSGQMMHRGQVVMKAGLPIKKTPKGR